MPFWRNRTTGAAPVPPGLPGAGRSGSGGVTSRRSVQTALNAAAIRVGIADGVASQTIRAGVRTFQARIGAEPTGQLMPAEAEASRVAAGFTAAPVVATTVPERHTACLRDGLRSFALPLATPEITVSMVWHPRLGADPGHRWLRRILQEIVRAEPFQVADRSSA